MPNGAETTMMTRLGYVCPVKGNTLDIGITADLEMLVHRTGLTIRVNCPHCGSHDVAPSDLVEFVGETTEPLDSPRLRTGSIGA